MKLLAFLFLLGTCLALDQNVRYVHLALTQTPTEMMVGWYTQDLTDTSICKYGLTANNLNQVAVGNSSFWRAGYGNNHFAKLQNLSPNQLYFYQCGDQKGGFSKVLQLTTAPATSVPFTIGIYGDLGIDNSNNTMEGVKKRTLSGELDWIFHVGDISYADDHVFTFQETWNEWFQRMEPITSAVPYMVGPGNHEYTSYDPFLFFSTQNFVVYNQRFLMPNANSQSKSMYFSFDYSNVHFISYSTETSFPGAPYGGTDNFGDEVAWLKQDLINANLPANRKQRPWIIVTGHRPIYSSSVGYSYQGVPINSIDPPSNSLTLQQTFEDLFVQYKVDLIFNGHVHSYERNYPAYQNTKTSEYVEPKTPFNIVVGCAGNIEDLEDPDPSDWTQPQPEWSAYRYGEDYGYGVLKIFNDTTLSWSFYRATDNGLQDQVTVIKHH